MSEKRVAYTRRVHKAADMVKNALNVGEPVRGVKANLTRQFAERYRVSPNSIKCYLKRNKVAKPKKHGNHLLTVQEEVKLVALLRALELQSRQITEKLVNLLLIFVIYEV